MNTTCRIRATGYLAGMVIAFALFPTIPTGASAPPPKAATDLSVSYDSAFQPVDKAQLVAAIQANWKNVNILVQLIRQASEQEVIMDALSTISDLLEKNPHNPVLLSGYCLAADFARGSLNNRKDKVYITESDFDQSLHDERLAEAMTRDPNLWLPYALKGEFLVRTGLDDKAGFDAMNRMIALAPRSSYAHFLLGEAYTMLDTDHTSLPKAEHELTIALTLTPPIADAGGILFEISDVISPDRAKAKLARKLFLQALPPGAHLNKEMETRLAKYAD